MSTTPGPWAIEYDGARPASIGHENILVASLSGPNPISNANLIAASPDLLAACKAVVEHLGNRTRTTGAMAAVGMCRSAIIKAQGVSNA